MTVKDRGPHAPRGRRGRPAAARHRRAARDRRRRDPAGATLGTLDGVLLGDLASPRVEATLAGEDVRAWDVDWGTGPGEFVVEDSYLDVIAGDLRRDDSAMRVADWSLAPYVRMSQRLQASLLDYEIGNDGPIRLSLDRRVVGIDRLRLASVGTALDLTGWWISATTRSRSASTATPTSTSSRGCSRAFAGRARPSLTPRSPAPCGSPC